MKTSFEHSIPLELVTHVTSGCGRPGQEWLGELPAIIEKLERRWSVSVQAPFPGIEYNFVAPASGKNGEAVVIKIAPPWDPVEIFGEAAWLRHRNGDGCVKLLAVERESRALLLDQIFPGLPLSEYFTGREVEAVDPAVDALKAVLLPVPNDLADVVSLDDWFAGLRKFPDTAFPADYAVKALAIYDKLSGSRGPRLYLHGDYHPGNIVTRGASDFCVIDPKGVAGDLGYEIAVFLNNFHWWQESRADIRPRLDAAVRRFATAFDIAPAELRQWAYAQMVIGAWWNFVDMPDLYDGSVVKADIWDV